MKKGLLMMVLALVMTMVLSVGALAEENYVEIKARDVVVNRNTETMGCRFDGVDDYCLIDAHGNPVTEPLYAEMRAVSDAPFFRVSVHAADGVHDEGLIDEKGNTLIPCQYADVSVISDRWATGVKLVPSSSDDKDYTFTNWNTNEKSFYRIETVDFYFRGTLAGTLTRSEYDGYPMAYGDYICVTARDKTKTYYNSRMEKSPKQGEYGEYETTYHRGKSTYTHNGSGQEAFTAGCTLTPDEVVQSIVYENGKVYDLQGGEPFKPAQNYDLVRTFKGGYAVVSMNRMKGLIDETGKEIIPVEYDDVGNYEDDPLRYGCISVVKDGKFGFVDASNRVTCNFVYPNDIVTNRGTFGSVKNLDGTIIVLSGRVGELPEHYAEVSMMTGARAFQATNAEGNVALIDIFGQTLVPYTDAYSISYNRDATVAAISMGGRVYRIYHFEKASQEEKAKGSAAAGDTWTCSNGHEGNTGNFCGKCGEPRPAEKQEDEKIFCTGCGTAYEGPDIPNFCPNCGTKLK